MDLQPLFLISFHIHEVLAEWKLEYMCLVILQDSEICHPKTYNFVPFICELCIAVTNWLLIIKGGQSL